MTTKLKISKKNEAFVKEWLTNGNNAKRAYMAINPTVKERTAEELGSRMLRNVKIKELQ